MFKVTWYFESAALVICSMVFTSLSTMSSVSMAGRPTWPSSVAERKWRQMVDLSRSMMAATCDGLLPSPWRPEPPRHDRSLLRRRKNERTEEH